MTEKNRGAQAAEWHRYLHQEGILVEDSPGEECGPWHHRVFIDGIESVASTGAGAAPRHYEWDALDKALLQVYGKPQGTNAQAILNALAQDGYAVAASSPAAGLPFDDRPCQTDCCDNQRGRHIHEGTHEDHVGDGGWCIDCDVVIGEAGENRSSPAIGLDRLRDILDRTYPAMPVHELWDVINEARAALGESDR